MSSGVPILVIQILRDVAASHVGFHFREKTRNQEAPGAQEVTTSSGHFDKKSPPVQDCA